MQTRIRPAGPADGMLTWEQQYLSYLRNMGRLRPQTEQELKRCTDEAFRAINPTAEPHEFKLRGHSRSGTGRENRVDD